MYSVWVRFPEPHTQTDFVRRYDTWHQQPSIHDQVAAAKRHRHSRSRNWSLHHHYYFLHVAVALVQYYCIILELYPFGPPTPMKVFQFASNRRTAPRSASFTSSVQSSSIGHPLTWATICNISRHLSVHLLMLSVSDSMRIRSGAHAAINALRLFERPLIVVDTDIQTLGWRFC